MENNQEVSEIEISFLFFNMDIVSITYLCKYILYIFIFVDVLCTRIWEMWVSTIVLLWLLDTSDLNPNWVRIGCIQQ